MFYEDVVINFPIIQYISLIHQAQFFLKSEATQEWNKVCSSRRVNAAVNNTSRTCLTYIFFCSSFMIFLSPYLASDNATIKPSLVIKKKAKSLKYLIHCSKEAWKAAFTPLLNYLLFIVQSFGFQIEHIETWEICRSDTRALGVVDVQCSQGLSPLCFCSIWSLSVFSLLWTLFISE